MTGVTASPVRFRVSPNFGERRGGLRPQLIVLHYTGMESGAAAENWLCDPRSQVSSHYLVHEDGTIVQLVDEEMRAWHAGAGQWRGITDVNSASVGIEIVNPGHFLGYPDFPAPQIGAVAALCRQIAARWRIRPQDILAHSDTAPGRKIDPGEKFPWAALHAAGVGHYVPPLPPDPSPADPPARELREVQAMLARYGYGIEADGVCDAHTRSVIAAFQRHFRPARVDGIADRSTVRTLRALLAALG